jgi:Predicted membrane protein (DUF2339)
MPLVGRDEHRFAFVNSNMNDQDRLDLDAIKAIQTELKNRLADLDRRILKLESEGAVPPRESPARPPAAVPVSGAGPGPSQATRTRPTTGAVPPPLPASALATAAPSGSAVPVDTRASATPLETEEPTHIPKGGEPSPTPSFPTGSAPILPKPKPPPGSFEMRLGTYWLVRVGIVVLLTGLAFFGYFAYEHVVPRLGPAGKVTLLYLASAALLGLGQWFQRNQVKASLRNWGQVVFAGGLASVYFTTYAAHHFQNLQVIPSALWDGVMLMAWAGFMVWLADRKQSEVLALFGIGLAYYTSFVTDIGHFTLFSNLVLSGAALTFLIRNRWAALSYVSLVATYAGYFWWRFMVDGQPVWRTEELERFWDGNLFLLGYWLIFSVAWFVSKNERFVRHERLAFLSFNNAAFFTLITLSLLPGRRDWFWMFSLGYGAVLLGVTVLAKRLIPKEPVAWNLCLAKGLVLITVGFIAKFSGLHLGLLLAAQSVVLAVAGERLRLRVVRIGSGLVGLLALAWTVANVKAFDSEGLVLGTAVGAMLVFNSIWSARFEPEIVSAAHSGSALRSPALRLRTTWFAFLGLISWLVTTWRNAAPEWFPVLVTGEAVFLTLSIYPLRVRELAMLGQLFVALGQLNLAQQLAAREQAVTGWSPLLTLAGALFLLHWWQRQRRLDVEPHFRVGVQMVHAFGICAVTHFWVYPDQTPAWWMVWSGLLALGFTGYAAATRAWPLAVAGQLFLVSGALTLARQFLGDHPDWYLPLPLIASFGGLSYLGTRLWGRAAGPESQLKTSLAALGMAYRWIAFAMLLAWVNESIPDREQCWVLALLSLVCFAWAGRDPNHQPLWFSGLAIAFSFYRFYWGETSYLPVYAPNLLAVLALLGQERAARLRPERYPVPPPVHQGAILAGVLSLWFYMTHWVHLHWGGFYVTVSWSVLALALFLCGLAMRERLYRWLALGLLACALGRVVLFDVRKLETIYRVLSFMALGIVLMVLGFIYNKYQEKIRTWL